MLAITRDSMDHPAIGRYPKRVSESFFVRNKLCVQIFQTSLSFILCNSNCRNWRTVHVCSEMRTFLFAFCSKHAENHSSLDWGVGTWRCTYVFNGARWLWFCSTDVTRSLDKHTPCNQRCREIKLKSPSMVNIFLVRIIFFIIYNLLSTFFY